LKVLHVYRTYFPDPPGGLQEAIRQISLATSNFGVNVKILTLSPHPDPVEIQRPEATVYRGKSFWAPASCDLGGVSAFRLYGELAHWADIIHYHYPWPFADVLNGIVKTDKIKVMTYHSDIIRQKLLGFFYAPLMKRTLSEMDAIVATSSVYAKTSKVLSRYVIPNRLRVIPLGIEDSVQAFDSIAANKYLDKWLLFDTPYVLALGVLRYYKGLHVLIQAAPSIRGKIVIAGFGPERDKLQEQAAILGVKNVIFVGQINDWEKNILLSHCRGLILASHLRSEAFGMVLVEASMHGKPMICCEVGSGTSFVNIHQETGFVVSPEDPAGLANGANILLSNELVAKRMGRSARQRYESFFSGRALGRAYVSLYEQLRALEHCK